MKIHIEDEDYPFDTNTTARAGDEIEAPLGGVIALVGQHLLDLQKALDELQKDDPGNMYQFYDIYATGILLAWDGVPIGVVASVDDTPTYVHLKQGDRLGTENGDHQK